MVVWPVPDPALRRDEPVPDGSDGLADASHIVIVLSSHSSAPDGEPHWASVLQGDARVIVVTCDRCTVPDALAAYPVVDFEGQFLPGFEELVRRLKRSHAPTRSLTIEHPPPVAKQDLLPLSLPAERCWREDRLRINYILPIILTAEELQTRLPAFLVQTNFELERATNKQVRGRRLRRYRLFDPRRAEHTITIKRRSGELGVYYRMARMQVFHWFPAHYRTLDREAAALYRYLVTGQLEGILKPVEQQARRAVLVSWGAIVVFWLVIFGLVYLILR